MVLANAIQQRNEAVIEDVEKVAERFVVVRRALQHQLCARDIKRAETACQSEKIHRHFSRRR